MATNKNQHFVPRCYLRPFTIDGANAAINLYNLDRQRFIEGAPVKNQCSGDYFYGDDALLEKAIRHVEEPYSTTLSEVLQPGYSLRNGHRTFLKVFWLLQHLRTEAASRRAVEMANATGELIKHDDPAFRLQIREAVQMAMRTFGEQIGIVDDLRVCLLSNRTGVPFITSDNPAVLTNRWHIETRRARGRSFGMQSAGALLLLPLTPEVFCLGYDGDVYSLPHEGGWIRILRESDVEALNQHQFLNCRANVFVRDPAHAHFVHESFLRAKQNRPTSRHILHYAIFDRVEGNYERYRVVQRDKAPKHQKAMIHSQVVHPRPTCWPHQIRFRPNGTVFTNDTGLGYVRRGSTNRPTKSPFRKESSR